MAKNSRSVAMPKRKRGGQPKPPGETVRRANVGVPPDAARWFEALSGNGSLSRGIRLAALAWFVQESARESTTEK